MKKQVLKIFIISFFIILLGRANAVFAAAEPAAFTLTFNDQKIPVTQDQLNQWQGSQTVLPENIFPTAPESIGLSLLKLAGQTTQPKIAGQTYSYNVAAIYSFVQQLASTTINVPTIEPVLDIQNSVVSKFVPPQTGTQVNSYKSTFNILSALQAGQTQAAIEANLSEPQTSLSQTNNLGINELIAHGVSGFKGSPNNRRHNIAVGVEKFKGLIIPQGATFSFDDNLGPVEAAEGFLPELVIKGSLGTIPELGGGLCQVSTTTFRAAMLAGLPITDRRNHAYAVSYYSPQGTDATIYPGSADLKFVNDTPGAILVWPYEPDKDTLIFDFYGTNDGRKVTLETPVVYDRKADGSMKATWTREIVSANGTEKTSVFKSNYQSPALFHKTEEFVPASTTPTTLQAPQTN